MTYLLSLCIWFLLSQYNYDVFVNTENVVSVIMVYVGSVMTLYAVFAITVCVLSVITVAGF